ncbi:hypothetical protein EV702DRAFT_1153258 [Suillus placidus]|uniref:Uncharacterized protein n=1 Tax=Suillus placidus TaxID=48579 RepID=A0A9P7CVT5_9AGAM|nr:hypothetical protein EV702DRAFT_1153258 [Suillus placidus]
MSINTEHQNLTAATASTSVSDGETNFWESSKHSPADESPNSSLQVISYQPSSPDWRRGDTTDIEYFSGEDDTSRRWAGFSAAYKSCKRHLEVDEEANSPEASPRKKIKETPPSPLEDVKLFPLPTRCFYPAENKQDNAMDQDNDSDEEYEVEKLTLELVPVLATPYLPQLNRLERGPYRVRQNSRGEPELYVPGRLAIDLSH